MSSQESKNKNSHSPKHKNQSSNLPLLAVYISFVLTYLLFDQNQITRPYKTIFKPFPVLSLILSIHNFKAPHLPIIQNMQIGLVFGVIGDIFLDFHENQFLFKLGVVAFLLGHVFYIRGIWQFQDKSMDKKQVSLFNEGIFVIIIAAFGFSSIYSIWNYLNTELRIGLTVYAVFLSLTLIVAYFKYQQLRNIEVKKAFKLIFIGALLFYISDSGIAQKKFNKQLSQQTKYLIKLVQFSFYFGAQYLIYRGTISLSFIYESIKQKNFKKD